MFQDLCEHWKDTSVIKLLGKNVGYIIMKDRLQRLWKPQDGFDILDVDNGYFVVTFVLQANKDKVVAGGPWMLFAHYLCVPMVT